MTKYEEAVRDLNQLEDLLYRMEKGNASKNTLLALARVVYFLLERWIREHEEEKKNVK